MCSSYGVLCRITPHFLRPDEALNSLLFQFGFVFQEILVRQNHLLDSSKLGQVLPRTATEWKTLSQRLRRRAKVVDNFGFPLLAVSDAHEMVEVAAARSLCNEMVSLLDFTKRRNRFFFEIFSEESFLNGFRTFFQFFPKVCHGRSAKTSQKQLSGVFLFSLRFLRLLLIYLYH